MSVKTFIVTLPDYSERLLKLSGLRKELSSIGLETELYYGVNGKEIHLENTQLNHLKTIHYKNDSYLYDATVRTNGAPMSKGEFGCAWSHLNLLKQLVNEPPSSAINYYLVLEDDVELVKPIEELACTLQNMPDDVDMCHLAKSDWYPFQKTKSVNDCFDECAKTYFNRTTAYLISKKGAEKVLAYTNNHINLPSDDLYCTIYRETSDFCFYVPKEYLFKEQDNITSTIGDINLQTENS